MCLLWWCVFLLHFCSNELNRTVCFSIFLSICLSVCLCMVWLWYGCIHIRLKHKTQTPRTNCENEKQAHSNILPSIYAIHSIYDVSIHPFMEANQAYIPNTSITFLLCLTIAKRLLPLHLHTTNQYWIQQISKFSSELAYSISSVHDFNWSLNHIRTIEQETPIAKALIWNVIPLLHFFVSKQIILKQI